MERDNHLSGPGFEVDFLQVGNGEKSGDCIVMRFGNLHSGDSRQQKVIVIDGGYKESGEKLVKFITDRYHTNHVDLVIATHLDSDHVSGLIPLVESLSIGAMLMQQPWLHNVGTGDASHEALSARDSYKAASELERAAIQAGIEIFEPYSGMQSLNIDENTTLTILGPSHEYYEELLKDFEHNKSAIDKLIAQFKSSTQNAAETIRDKIRETLDPESETLDDVHKNTAAANNSSAIIYINCLGRGLLFTGDSGVDALSQAADYASQVGINLTDLQLLDVPHHGSHHNLNGDILQRIYAQNAYISAAKDSPKHPSPRVINALLRRQFFVGTTEGSNIRFRFNSPDRTDYNSLESHSLVEEFEGE